MRVTKKVVVVCVSVLILAILGVFGIREFALPYRDYKNNLCNIAINGDTNTVGMSYDEINDYLKSKSNYTIEDLDLSDYINYDYTKIVDDLKNQTFTAYRLNRGESKDFDNTYSTYDIKTSELSNFIDEFNKSRTESKDATYKVKDNKFELVKAVFGNQINSEKFIDAISDLLKSDGELNDKIKYSKFYIEPSLKDEDMQKVLDNANKFANWSVKYSDGSEYKVDTKKYVSLNKDGNSFKVEVNNEFLSEIVNDIYPKFTTVGAKRTFKTHSGNKIKVSGGTWGSIVDKEEELKQLQELFANCEVQDNREPVYSLNYDKIGKSYIEVSISDQHVWFYKDGKCTMDSSCVTGNERLKHGTPRGIYFISERIGGKYLTGDGYKTWVNQWMRLTNTGIGLHDAYWRSSFGGSIYKTNGSHGCVNLPKNFAKKVFDESNRGMPVIIY